MPVRERFDPEANLLVVHLEGAIGDEDLLTYARRVVETPEIPAGHDELIDLRAMEAGGRITTPGLRRVAALFARTDRTPEQSRVAFVASSDVGYGLARMYQAFRSESPLELRVFRSMREARTWLGLPAE